MTFHTEMGEVMSEGVVERAPVPDRSRGRGVRRAATLVLAASLVAAACGGDDSDGEASTGSVAPGGTAQGAGPAAATGEPFVIGWNDSQTGPNGPGYLATGLAGVQTYLDDLNARGGVLGRPVELEVTDDRSDPPTAVTNFRQLADGESLAVFGSSVSSIAAAQLPLAKELKVALVAGGVPDAMTKEPDPYFFSTNLSHTGSAQVQLDFAKEQLAEDGVTKPKVAVFIVDTASGKEFEQYVVAQAEKLGWSVVEKQAYPYTDTDMSGQMANIERAKPDVVVSLVGSNHVPLFVTPLRQRGYSGLIVNSYAGSDEPAYQQIKDDKFMAPRSFVWPTDEVAKDMAAKAKASGQDDQLVSTYFTRGYVLGQLIEETLTACGAECDRAKFRDSLEKISSMDTKGLAGDLGFNGASDHLFVSQAQIYAWDAGASKAKSVSGWLDAVALK